MDRTSHEQMPYGNHLGMPVLMVLLRQLLLNFSRKLVHCWPTMSWRRWQQRLHRYHCFVWFYHQQFRVYLAGFFRLPHCFAGSYRCSRLCWRIRRRGDPCCWFLLCDGYCTAEIDQTWTVCSSAWDEGCECVMPPVVVCCERVDETWNGSGSMWLAA